MVKRLWLAAIAGLAMGSAACSSAEEMSAAIGADAQASGQKAAAQGAGTASDASPFAMNDTERDGEAERAFSYSWPRAVSAIPALAQMLGAQRDKSLAEQKSEWADQRANCPPDSGGCANNQLEVGWEVVANTQRFLSLSSSLYSYSGGAHGNYGRSSLIWDRQVGEALEPTALFVSAEALGQAIRPAACRLLNAEREERRGEPVPADASEWPNHCPAMDETVIFLGSAKGKAFDRIGVYYGPYVAGAYAEGDFEFTLPVSPAILAAVKPQYRAAFARGS